FPPQLSRYDGGEMPHGASVDCVLQAFDACSGWVWIFNEDEGAVWGTVLDVGDCPGLYDRTANVKEIYLYTVCTSTPASFGGVAITDVDAMNCPTALLYQSGPITLTNCTAGNHWTVIQTPLTRVGSKFAITVTWGPRVNGTSNPQFVLDEEGADDV